jgi:serine/threonine protein kinase
LHTAKPPFNEHEQIHLARGIASGMINIHAEKILHRVRSLRTTLSRTQALILFFLLLQDLSARNVLLDTDLTPKVADFGLSDVTVTNNFEERRIVGSFGPIRWMAPESIRSQVFSTKSDVFAYGILLWEIMSKGALPHSEEKNLQTVGVRRRRVIRSFLD